jgi:hypothetical protein
MFPTSANTPAGIKPFQIIYIAFVTGIMMFVTVTLVLGLAPVKTNVAPSTSQVNVLLLALLAHSLAALGIGIFFWFNFANTAGKNWNQRLDDESGAASMLRLFGTRTILVGALAESVGLFAAVILFLHGTPLAHIAIAASILTLAVLFPTRQKLQTFVRLATESTGKGL